MKEFDLMALESASSSWQFELLGVRHNPQIRLHGSCNKVTRSIVQLQKSVANKYVPVMVKGRWQDCYILGVVDLFHGHDDSRRHDRVKL
ncbi:unnamed protein product [Peronospora belbahrii]|uniref:PIPK domain-containing protein n=1 Tax=Peronospora belbahrii TaxID=622444 RepID=A0ABN8CWK4_9STRA|nr:unnamed protein product [Peronospora belbahrii]